MTNATGAQRLSASSNSSLISLRMSSNRAPCAQRLSASSNSSRQTLSRLRTAGLMCSTPFGIFEFITVAVGITSHGVLRAQRLSASSNSSHGFPWGWGQSPPGAQRLSASSNSSPIPSLLAVLNGLSCSTPFGIFEFITAGCIRMINRSQLCSTPFGIFEFITAAVRYSPGSITSCSTPFGIFEFITASAISVFVDKRYDSTFQAYSCFSRNTREC